MCENVHLDRVVDASRPVRDPYWDIMKGLGIIAVAAGHAMVLPIEVNYYHIALFFFVGGALFKSEKCRDYGHFFMKKFKGLWWPFFLYNAFFFCLQPFFLWIRFLSLGENPFGVCMIVKPLDFYGTVTAIVGVFFNGDVNVLSGATWFMAPFMLQVLLFGGVIHCREACGWSNRRLSVVILILFVLGIALVKHSIGRQLSLDLALLMMPIAYAGFLWREKKLLWQEKIALLRYKKLAVLGVVIACIAIFFCLEKENLQISIAGRLINNWAIFLLASFAGICLNLFIARGLAYSAVCTKIFSHIGRKSFHIMALHFLGFKMVNLFYIFIYDKSSDLLSLYVVDMSLFWRCCCLAGGIAFPLFLVRSYAFIKNRLLEK